MDRSIMPIDSPARDKPPDELVWPLRLFLILLGYSTVATPAAILIYYVRRNRHAFETPYLSIRLLLRSFAVGNPEYQLIPTGEKQARKENDSIPQTRAQCINVIILLLFFFSGIQVTLVAMGVLQERIITRGYRRSDQLEVEDKFGETQFLIFCNRIVALVLSLMILAKDWTKQPPHVPPLYVHSYTSFSNTISSWCQYEALKYVSFPTQTICKASKVVVTMLMGRLVRGQRYSWFEYGCGCTIAFGASLFLLSSSSKGAGSTITYTSFSGMILMAGYLLFDAFTLNWQKALFDTKPKVSKYQMMFGVNFFSAILCAVSLIEQGTLWSSIKFGAEHVDFSRDVFLLSLSGAIGQIFIYSTIERFGPIVFAVIMTIRQMLSIVLSTIMYGHELTFLAAIGFMIVFAAIFVDIHKKYSDKSRGPQRSW
ncbi:Adenosine 3'-phospho 5'-phosphosulfate transporter 1 [Caenorhabditis elegans]|uniref:Adenosine 3'-phospho 5'-phosphosulfate transporter 1 n=1 Tax=Caenorhabditis elegans TaxID=6239 RepID=S35B2_CAEEL|nr:Adenosine 3'-phospho 5'-phosphosulfate transporter 1 [Caenorhabditis elegans]Q8MXJ9.4 RecName: Full=Adenosine 3'-phospho 5'-phosphosulfate transporter 1; AltName: Full=PAPS transporter 1 [Caenorhabditis elegans]CCD64140.1 Adenosine 3'-phospho 5'-phosphosulfate transporter 1 [Caenorhabditis elegans]|eukprot:NP_741545.2 Adenosine 3'-phospho 5'-phosphosulfate transporter 1 [Caenorhabditis elegans]